MPPAALPAAARILASFLLKTTQQAPTPGAGKFRPREAAVNYSSNDIDSMLHMNANASTLQGYPKLSTYHQRNAASVQAANADPLCALMQHVAVNGEDVVKIAEDTLEALQEEFILYVQKKLEDNKINLQDKLNISLSHNNTLVIECADDNEKILSALGEDEHVHAMFMQLQRYAYIINGVHLLQAGESNGNNTPQRYNMCLKGPLSHFYLK